MSGHSQQRGVLRTLIDNSFLLIAGAVAALVWANLAHQRGSTSYQDFINYDVREIPHDLRADQRRDARREHPTLNTPTLNRLLPPIRRTVQTNNLARVLERPPHHTAITTPTMIMSRITSGTTWDSSSTMC